MKHLLLGMMLVPGRDGDDMVMRQRWAQSLVVKKSMLVEEVAVVLHEQAGG